MGGDPPKDMMKAQGARHAASFGKVAKEKSDMKVELRKVREAKVAARSALSLQPETEVAALDLEAALADLNNKHEANLAELVRDLNEKVST